MRRGKHGQSKIFAFLVAVTAALGGAALHARAGDSAQALGEIDGTVTAGGAALTGATVSIDGNHLHRAATTDGSGHFAVGGLPAGSYRVLAAATGYSAARAQVTVTAGSTTSVALALTAAPAKPEPADHGRAEHEKVELPKETADKSPRPASAPSEKMPPPPPMPRPASPATAIPPSGGGAALVITSKPGGAGVNQPADDRDMNTEQYARIDDNPYFRTDARPLSTFSVDVDTASYANTRRFLRDGQLPPRDAVRVEELVNYFHYDDPAPRGGEPFSVTTEVGPSPWNEKLQLVRIGLRTPDIDDEKVPARNLVFLIDVSGSMEDANKLPLLKRALGLLVEQLRPQDKVAMVVYAGNSGLALPATGGARKDAIRNALAGLEAGGSTNGAEGIQLAYQVARQSFIKGGINRVILCTDGDFNVGVTSEGELTRLIEGAREHGVFLTVLGFGMGNIKDSTMEKLADRGNGNYAYIDSIEEARKVLVKEAGATLVTVAKDVKLQVEFNPATVAGYRLIGYENRLLRDEDFNDDKKDAGDIGAGHSVTALYELVPVGVEVPGAKVDPLKYQTGRAPSASAGASELMTVKIRYKAPDGKTSKLLSQAVKPAQTDLARTSNDFRWSAAVAGFGMMLRESPFRGHVSWPSVASLAKGAVGSDLEGYRSEFLKMIAVAGKLAGATAVAH
jgi:Ca-activated chloride channel homolog